MYRKIKIYLVFFAVAGLQASYASAGSLLDASTSYEARMGMVNGFPVPYSAENRAEIYAVLNLLPSDSALAEIDLASLKNEIADKLLAEKPIRSETIELLYAGLLDANQGAIWQDYILQKTSRICAAAQDVDERNRWIQKVREYTTVNDGSIAGTALLALLRIEPLPGDSLEVDTVQAIAASMLESSETPVSSKLTALVVSAQLDPEGTFAHARSILNQENSPVMLKVGGIYALSESHLESDIELIQKYKVHRDVRLRRASTAASTEQ